MSAASVTGVGPGMADMLTTKDLSILTNGPSIVIANTESTDEVISSSPPASFSGMALFPTHLPGSSDNYSVLITPVNATNVYVTNLIETAGNFVGFTFYAENICTIMYLVVTKGIKPTV